MTEKIEKVIVDYIKEQAPVLFILIDGEKEIIETNEYADRLLGKDLIGKKVNQIFIDFDNSLNIDELIEGSIDRYKLNMNTSSDLPDTLYFSFFDLGEKTLIFGKPNIDELENLRKKMVSLNNEFANLSRKLQKRNAELRKTEKALDSSINGVSITNDAGIITYVNPKILSMWKFEKGNLIGENISKLFEDSNKIDEIINTLEDKDEWKDEFKTIKKDGTDFYVKGSAAVIVSEDNKKEGIIFNFIDITERKKAEEREEMLKERLQDSVSRYRNLLNTLNDSVVIHDEDGNFLEANKATIKLWGYSREELFEKNLYDIVSNESAEKINDRMNQLEDKENLVFESKHINKSGHEIFVEVNTKMIEFMNKKAFMSVIRDITDRRRFRRREFYYSLLRQDMKNKLSTSTGYMQLLEDSGLSEENKDFVRKAIDINKLGLDIVKLAEHINQTDTNEIRTIDINEIFKSSYKSCQGIIDSKNIECEKDIEGVSCRVRGEPNFDSVLSTLIKTRAIGQDSKKMKVRIREQVDDVLISIEDDGNFISDDIREDLSDGEYTGDTSGLGGPVYYAVRDILKNYGGRMEFNRSELGGTRFDIYLRKEKE